MYQSLTDAHGIAMVTMPWSFIDTQTEKGQVRKFDLEFKVLLPYGIQGVSSDVIGSFGLFRTIGLDSYYLQGDKYRRLEVIKVQKLS